MISDNFQYIDYKKRLLSEMEYELALSFSKKETLYLQTFLRLFAESPQIPGVISFLDSAAPFDDGSNSSMPVMSFSVPKNQYFKFKTKSKCKHTSKHLYQQIDRTELCCFPSSIVG